MTDSRQSTWEEDVVRGLTLAAAGSKHGQTPPHMSVPYRPRSRSLDSILEKLNKLDVAQPLPLLAEAERCCCRSPLSLLLRVLERLERQAESSPPYE